MGESPRGASGQVNGVSHVGPPRHDESVEGPAHSRDSLLWRGDSSLRLLDSIPPNAAFTSALKLLACAREIMRLLRRSNAGMSLAELTRGAQSKPATVTKAINWLKDQGADIVYEPAARVRKLLNPEFVLPLVDPDAEDVTALRVAAAVVGPLVEPATRRRLERLIEDLDELRREQAGKGVPGPTAITTGVTLSTSVAPT